MNKITEIETTVNQKKKTGKTTLSIQDNFGVKKTNFEGIS